MGWTFFWLMVVLKIPIIAAIALVWWAVRAVPDPVVAADDPPPGDDEDGGSKVPPSHRPTPRRPTRPRGPHGDPSPPSPPRVRRPVSARARASG